VHGSRNKELIMTVRTIPMVLLALGMFFTAGEPFAHASVITDGFSCDESCFTIVAVPEPSTLAVFGASLLGLFALRRMRK
jgi:hypothetical protein